MLRQLLLVAAGVAGAALLQIPAAAYRIDRVACASWPLPSVGVLPQLVYLLAVALLSVAWLGMARTGDDGEQRLGRVLALGLAVHAVALLVPPFLSEDPLFYAAIGRALVLHHDPYLQRIGDALPAGDPFLAVLPGAWRGGTSAYSPGFHLLCWAAAKLGGSSVWAVLKLFQALGLVAVASAATLTGLATRSARAAALVLFCPLAVIEGTVGAHNDALLAAGAALFALCVVRGRPLLALVGSAGGLAVKASGLLLFGMHALALLLAKTRRRRFPSLALAAGALLTLALLVPLLQRVTRLFSSGSADDDFCTPRSIECGLRWLLRHGLGLGTAAWALGLAFRAAGVALLLGCALRATDEKRLLASAAALLFAWYLYFQGWAQPWYWLPLLPLLPFADAALKRAMHLSCVVAVAWYPLYLGFRCADEQQLPLWTRGASAVLEAALFNLPATWLLWRDRRRAPA